MDNRIIVAGGEIAHSSPMSDVTAYDPLSNSWTELTPLPAALLSGVAGSIGNQIFFTTGSPSPGFTTTTYTGVPANDNLGIPSAPPPALGNGNNGNIEVVTPDAAIVQNRMVFSTVNEEVRPPKTLTIRNTGNRRLRITSLTLGDSQENIAVRSADNQRAADFRLVNAPTLPVNLAPNASLKLSVEFAPQRDSRVSNSATHLLNGENYASLNITSNDPDQPMTTVNLAGLNAADYEGSYEPSVTEIARTFGFRVNIGTEMKNLGGAKTLLGDEVYSPYWLRADTTKPVLLWPLAVYSGPTNRQHAAVRFEAKPGNGGNSGLIYQLAGRNNDDNVPGSNDLSGGENQKLLPKSLVNNVNRVPTPNTVSFIPTTPFALNVPGFNGPSWTDDSQNTPGKLHNWRIFPVRDALGNVIPNTWYAIEDIGNIDSRPLGKNFDYNDLVYLLVNARPESVGLSP
jgi:hypothetical protein